MDGHSAWRDVTRDVLGRVPPLRVTCATAAAEYLVIGGDDGAVALLRLRLGRSTNPTEGSLLETTLLRHLAPPPRIQAHAPVTSVAWCAKKRLLAIGTGDGFVNVLAIPDAPKAAPVGIFSQRLHPAGAVTQLLFGAWSRRLFSACHGGLLNVTLLPENSFSLFQSAKTARILQHPSPVVQLDGGVLCGYTHEGLDGEVEVQAILSTFAEAPADRAKEVTGKERRLYFFLPPGTAAAADLTPLAAEGIYEEGSSRPPDDGGSQPPQAAPSGGSPPTSKSTKMFLRHGACFVRQGNRVGNEVQSTAKHTAAKNGRPAFSPLDEIEGGFCSRPDGILWKISCSTGDLLAAFRPKYETPDGSKQGSFLRLHAMTSMTGERQPQLLGYHPGKPGVTLIDPRTLETVTLAKSQFPVTLAVPLAFPGFAGCILCIHQPPMQAPARTQPLPIMGLIAPDLVVQGVIIRGAQNFPKQLRSNGESMDNGDKRREDNGDKRREDTMPWDERAEIVEMSLEGLEKKTLSDLAESPASLVGTPWSRVAEGKEDENARKEEIQLPPTTGDVVRDADALLQLHRERRKAAKRNQHGEEAESYQDVDELLRASERLVEATETTLDGTEKPKAAGSLKRRRRRLDRHRQRYDVAPGVWARRYGRPQMPSREIVDRIPRKEDVPQNVYEECLSLRDGPSLGLGLGIVGNKVVVKGLNPLPNGLPSPAQASARLTVGDLLVGVNDYDFDKMVFFEIVKVLQTLPTIATADGKVRFRFRVADCPVPRGAFDAADVGHDRPWRPPINTAMSASGPNAPSRVSVGVGVGMEVGAEMASLALEGGSRILGKFQSLRGHRRQATTPRVASVKRAERYESEDDDDGRDLRNPLEDMFQEMIASPLREASLQQGDQAYDDSDDVEDIFSDDSSEHDGSPMVAIPAYKSRPYNPYGEVRDSRSPEKRRGTAGVFVFSPLVSGLNRSTLASLMRRSRSHASRYGKRTVGSLSSQDSSMRETESEGQEEEARIQLKVQEEKREGGLYRWGRNGLGDGGLATHISAHPNMGFDLSDEHMHARLEDIAEDVRYLASARVVSQESFFFWRRNFPRSLRPRLGRGSVSGVYIWNRLSSKHHEGVPARCNPFEDVKDRIHNEAKKISTGSMKDLMQNHEWIAESSFADTRHEMSVRRAGSDTTVDVLSDGILDDDEAWWMEGLHTAAGEVSGFVGSQSISRLALESTAAYDSDAEDPMWRPLIPEAPHQEFLRRVLASEANVPAQAKRTSRHSRLQKVELDILRDIEAKTKQFVSGGDSKGLADWERCSVDHSCALLCEGLEMYTHKKLQSHLLSYNAVFPNRSPTSSRPTGGVPIWLPVGAAAKNENLVPAGISNIGNAVSVGGLALKAMVFGGDSGSLGETWTRVAESLPPAGLTYLTALLVFRHCADFQNTDLIQETLVPWLRTFTPLPFKSRGKLGSVRDDDMNAPGALDDPHVLQTYLYNEPFQRSCHRALTFDLVTAYFICSACGPDVDIDVGASSFGGTLSVRPRELRDESSTTSVEGGEEHRDACYPGLWSEEQGLAFVEEYGAYLRLPLVVRACSVRQWNRAQDRVFGMVEMLING